MRETRRGLSAVEAVVRVIRIAVEERAALALTQAGRTAAERGIARRRAEAGARLLAECERSGAFAAAVCAANADDLGERVSQALARLAITPPPVGNELVCPRSRRTRPRRGPDEISPVAFGAVHPSPPPYEPLPAGPPRASWDPRIPYEPLRFIEPAHPAPLAPPAIGAAPLAPPVVIESVARPPLAPWPTLRANTAPVAGAMRPGAENAANAQWVPGAPRVGEKPPPRPGCYSDQLITDLKSAVARRAIQIGVGVQ